MIYIFIHLLRVHKHIQTNMINGKWDFVKYLGRDAATLMLTTLSFPLCHTVMSEPLDVGRGLIQVLNEQCFINGAIIRLPAGGQAPSIFLLGGLTMSKE